MSSALPVALNLFSVSHSPMARPFTNLYPTFQERYLFRKSATSKKLKEVISVAPKKSSVFAISTSAEDAPVARASANFHPSVWGGFFLAFENMEPFPEEQEQEMKQLKEEILALLKRTPDASPLKLDLIDHIQRLGVLYQFNDEIEESLSNIYNSYNKESQDDLHTVALRFRLLRQHGHYISSDVLKKFQDHKGKFDEASLENDVRGLLSLYEASHYSVHGEEILQEALTFSTFTLEGMVNTSTGFVANKIIQALTWPIRKTLNRVTSRKYISLYEQDQSRDEVLLRYAKLDFNRLQRMHQQELCALTKWWKGMDCATNYPFVRDRLVESYFIILGLYFEPQYSLARIMLHKLHNIFSIFDDIYDTYGTMDELLPLTDAIERWNMDAVNQLPPYMRLCYQYLLECYTEMEDELAKHGWSERVPYAKAELQKYLKLSLEDALRHHTGYLPTYEEYMEKGVLFNGVNLLLTISYMGMGDLVTKGVLDWAVSEPSVTRAASTISRLIDDICDHEESEHATAVECYMNQYGVSKQEAIEELQKHINNSWKDLNKECLLPTAVPPAIIERVLNTARMMYTTFKYGDSYTNPETSTKQLLKSILVDPIIL